MGKQTDNLSDECEPLNPERYAQRAWNCCRKPVNSAFCPECGSRRPAPADIDDFWSHKAIRLLGGPLGGSTIHGCSFHSLDLLFLRRGEDDGLVQCCYRIGGVNRKGELTAAFKGLYQVVAEEEQAAVAESVIA